MLGGPFGFVPSWGAGAGVCCRDAVYRITVPSGWGEVGRGNGGTKAELISVLEPLNSLCSQVTELPDQFSEMCVFTVM